ncbi:hypothetical protein [Acetobacter sp.]|uniref:hypothetical protein n=1 Tax=Acetobacter sp. TaxID=440 RepID=UPI0025B97DCD|nr:hypothetical protein [Acetobacter sp.]MCH4091696.1 hypothetical protein [Acetobacter sp.]MCI1300447.1 hypothetical protein [Acetobacter sp.]MCI1316734.1 hypothetical protein [Acetobacter sp.]
MIEGLNTTACAAHFPHTVAAAVIREFPIAGEQQAVTRGLSGPTVLAEYVARRVKGKIFQARVARRAQKTPGGVIAVAGQAPEMVGKAVS